MHCQFRYRYPEVPDDWWRLDDAKSGCWVLGDIGTHFIDLLHWFNGEAKTVHAHLANKAYGRSADTAVVSIGFANGAVGTITASTAVTTGGGFELLGSESCCTIEGGFVGIPGHHDHGAHGAASRAPSRSRATTPTRPRLRASTRAVARGTPVAVTAQDGLANVRVIEQARGW